MLAAAGVGSRREVERWIREGRLLINGAVPELGAKLEADAKITLDGRPIRVNANAKRTNVLLVHRSPGEPLDIAAATAKVAEQLQLPRKLARWVAIQPLPPVDGGLEMLTDDGNWAHWVARGAHALTVDYMLRMRGELNDALVEEFRAATHQEEEPLVIVGAEAQYGEGSNHWLTVTVRDTRAAPLRHWWAARGLIVSRLMRVRFGPVHLTRDLGRGRVRTLLPAERNALENEIRAAHAPQEPAGEASA